MKINILLPIILFSLLIGGCGNKYQPEPSEPNARTYYESLDLSSPENTVKTFTDAYKKADFLTVYLVLSQYAQWKMEQSAISLQFNYPIQFDKRHRIFHEIWPGFTNREHTFEPLYIFDQIMLWAKNNSFLLIDFNKKISIISVNQSDSKYADDTKDVVISMVDFDGEIIFRTVQAPSGRWRVLQVILPGGDEEKVPWAIPPQNE